MSTVRILSDSPAEKETPANPAPSVPIPKNKTPMTVDLREYVGDLVSDLIRDRDVLDQELVAEAEKPATKKRYSARKKLLRRAEVMLERERTFLRRWDSELKRHEQLLK